MRPAGVSSQTFRSLALLVFTVAMVVFSAYATSRGDLTITASVSSGNAGDLQVFHGARAAFTERRSDWFATGVDPGTIQIRTRGRGAAWLRIDPPIRTVSRICGLRVDQDGPEASYELHATWQANAWVAGACIRIQPTPGADDPQLVIRFTEQAADRIMSAGRWWILALVGWTAAAVLLLRVLLSAVRWVQPRLPTGCRPLLLDRHLPGIFGALLVVFGACYIIVTPPGAVPDEEAHFAKVIRVSQGILIGDADDRPIPNPRAMYGPFVDYLFNKEPFLPSQLKAQLAQPLICGPGDAHPAKGANGYSPHLYLVPSLVYLGSCKAGASFGTFLYLSRAANLLLAAALMTFGLYHAGWGRWGLLLAALLPMSIFQMASISADSLTLSLSLGWLGLVSGIASGKLSPARASPALWVFSLGIAFLKPGAAWILICLAFCKPVYDAARLPFGAALAKHLALPWVIHIGWLMAAADSAMIADGVDASANFQRLMADPSSAIRILAATVQHRGIDLARMMVGTLGWLDVPLAEWTYRVAAMLAAAALFSNRPDVRPPGPAIAVAALVVAMASMVMIALPLLVTWTPAQSAVVLGLQGRYFTLSAAFALVWCSFRSPGAIRGVLLTLILAGVIVINIDAIVRLYEAYFIFGRH